MRIAVDASGLAPGTSGGIEQFTYRLLEGMCAAGPADQFEVLIATGTRGEWQRRVPPAANLRLWEVTTTASLRAAVEAGRTGASVARRSLSFARRSVLARRAGYAWKRWQRDRTLARLAPHVIYLPTDVGGCPDPSAVAGAKVVVTVHDLRSLSVEFGDPLFAAAHRQCVRRAAAVVTSWEHPRSQLLERYPDLEPRLFTVGFPGLLAARAGPAATREVPYLLYPASTLPHKNHVRLLQALAEIRSTLDVRLVCTGPLVEPGAGQVRRTVRELDLDGSVEMLGHVSDDELSALYRGCVAVVVPSLWEAASGPIMEALAFGRPICCSDIEPIRQQVAGAGARVAFFDGLDVADIARAMREVLADPNRFTGTDSPAAPASGEGRTWREVGEAYLSIFRSVAG